MTRNCYVHSGDLGDVIAALPVMRSLGEGDLVVTEPSAAKQVRESLKGSRFMAIKPLLESLPYLHSVRWSDKTPSEMTHDFRGFRIAPEYGESLLDWQARYLGVKPCTDPWLNAFRSPLSIGRNVIARSSRYQNPGFPWHAVLQKWRNPLFVGTEDEHNEFCRVFGRVEYAPTKNLLELAEIINGANLFVGNQSCPFWIAAGLGVPLIQETFPQSPNSMVRRPNARYLMRGPFTL